MPDATPAADLTLGADFPPATGEEWLAAVTRALRGADFDRTLVHTTLDGLRIQPLYTADDIATEADEAGFPGRAPLVRGQRAAPRPDGAWDIRGRVAQPDPARANADVLAELRGGATSVEIVVDAGGTGVSCRTVDDLDRVLSGVLLDVAPISLRAGAHAAAVATWLTEIWSARDLPGDQVAGCLGLDPLGVLAEDGVLATGLDAALAEAVAHARTASRRTPRVRAFRASGLVAADAGASEGQEIGFVLAAATAYLRAMVDAGLPVATAARQITVEAFADVDLFSTIAKVRALRHCWATILQASAAAPAGAGDPPVVIDAYAGGRWQTVVDPWVNLLRGTTATLGAVLGGADAVVVSAFDSASGPGADQGRRLARNTQLLLQDESAVGRVIDPAGGSYYVEALTDGFAAAGWAQFRNYEAAGGLAAALVSGQVAEGIARTAGERARLVATRRRPITGVSEFPLLGERRPEPDSRPDSRSALSGSGPEPRSALPADGTATRAPALVPRRLSTPFEDLRRRAEAAEPTVFCANVGTGAGHVARTTFAANLFAAGGVRAVGEGSYADASAAAAAFAASGAPVAVICGTDEAYDEHAADFARALKGAGARYVYLAGRPGPRGGEWTDAGVDEFVGVGVDAVDVLARLLDLMEVGP